MAGPVGPVASREPTQSVAVLDLGASAVRLVVAEPAEGGVRIRARPPASAGVCDACGAALVQRPDDTESVILERLRVYEERTMPAAEAYRERGVLREVNCSGSPEEVFSKLRAAVAES